MPAERRGDFIGHDLPAGLLQLLVPPGQRANANVRGVFVLNFSSLSGEQFFGVEGDAAMAAFFLDPARTTASLDRAARTAYTAGMGRNVGLDLDQTISDRVASLPSTYAGIWENLRSVASMNRDGGVFDEGFTETADLTAEGTGIDAVFFGDGAAAAQMERRILERDANARSSTGGAIITQAGAVGVS